MTNEDYGYYQFEATADGVENDITSNPAKLKAREDGLDLHITMFFDGTLNNLYNIEAREDYENKINSKAANIYKSRLDNGDSDPKEEEKEKKKEKKEDSYENNYSNVALLYQGFLSSNSSQLKTAAIYIEGMGTTKYENDSFDGYAFGTGKTGIPKRAEDGCTKLAKSIKDLKSTQKTRSITIDVFGFSRGAATARHFLHEITKPKEPARTEYYMTSELVPRSREIPAVPARGFFGKELERLGVTLEGEFKIGFAGLFDTVPSYKGFEHIGLDGVAHATDVLHLTAMDERSAQFALAKIHCHSNRKSKGTFSEKALPGVHSDVGGGYFPTCNELGRLIWKGNKDAAEREIDYLIEDGWYENRFQLTTEYFTFNKGIVGFLFNYCIKSGQKIVSNQYSYIPLCLMKQRASSPLNKIEFIQEFDNTYTVPDDLAYTQQRLIDYVFKNAQPMVYYTANELINEINQKVDPNKVNGLKQQINQKVNTDFGTTPSSPMKSAKPALGEQYYEKQSSTRVDQTNMKLKQELFIDKMKQSANLDPEYYVGYPELQQKLRDHHNLRMLRQKYVHTSHDCGLTASLTNNNLKVYEPYRMSVRDKPSRGEI